MISSLITSSCRTLRKFSTLSAPDGVTVVNNREQATAILQQLSSLPADTFFACDTEVADIDVTWQSPVGNGTVICASVYCGPDKDFGAGPKLWIDNLDGAEGVLDVFKPFFESETLKKVWHNYSFDRHVLWNHGIDCKGLGGDTMHMARTWNSARAKAGGYSLESLTNDLLNQRYVNIDCQDCFRIRFGDATSSKVPMKEIFSVPKLKKDGTPGKERILPPVETLQREEQWRNAWIDYSVFDAESTWELRNVLHEKLSSRYWVQEKTMYDFYMTYFVPYAQVLTDMERAGILVDVQTILPAAEALAKQERMDAEKHFIEWAASYCPDAIRMNVGSDAQKAHFLFAPCRKETKRARRKAGAATVSVAANPPPRLPEDQRPKLTDIVESELSDVEYELPELSPGSVDVANNMWPRERLFKIDNVEGYIEPGKKKPKKQREMKLTGLGMDPPERTASGWPAGSSSVLAKLAGKLDADPLRFGLAYNHFGGGEEGEEACRAIQSLVDISRIDTMLSNFILPLQQMADKDGRVHCSLNLNTETGRLSARRPNLQNQPALEKDRYKIRSAFTCAPGNALIVADYGQLELRLLAHMTKCKSMIEAFKAGGDFHSRTALGMYDYIREKVDSGEVLLEWDDSQGARPKPLLKDIYASERRKAKVLNFSIAYGKTAVGLSEDWNVSIEEAQATLQRWYEDRPEVRKWHQDVIQVAKADGATRTLMGRYRELPHINSSNRRLSGHAERAAINTPIQGGAADVVMMAMLKIANNERLKELGWTMLLQIHDEVILEGPEESQDEALQLVVSDMERPFQFPLLVDLAVDAGVAKTWYEAK